MPETTTGNPQRKVAYLLKMNRAGHITLFNTATGEDVYFQSEADVDAVKGHLTKNQKGSLELGWDVEIPASRKSQVSIFDEYFNSKTRTSHNEHRNPVSRFNNIWRD